MRDYKKSPSLNYYLEKEDACMGEYVLEMNNITKVFPGVKALDGVTLRVRKGKCPCINGRKWCWKINPNEMSIWYLS